MGGGGGFFWEGSNFPFQKFWAATCTDVHVCIKSFFFFSSHDVHVHCNNNSLLQVVSLLLNYGADITLCNSRGQSVLDFASDSMRPLLLGMLYNAFYIARHCGLDWFIAGWSLN